MKNLKEFERVLRENENQLFSTRPLKYQVIKDLAAFIPKFQHDTEYLKAHPEEFVVAIRKYVEYVLTYISQQDISKKNILIIKRCLQKLPCLFKDVELKNLFVEKTTQFIFDFVLEPNSKPWFGKEVLKMYNGCVADSSRDVRQKTIENIKIIYLYKLFDALSTYADYEFQSTILETVFRMCNYEYIEKNAKQFIPESALLSDGLLRISKKSFDLDVRNFLNLFNVLNVERNGAFSVVASTIVLDSLRFTEPIQTSEFDGIWLDFDVKEKSLSWTCDRSNLIPNSEERRLAWETITLYSCFVKNVYVRTPDNSSNMLIIMFQLEGPCITSQEHLQNQIDTFRELKILIKDFDKINDIVTQVLPTMFGKKFMNNRTNVHVKKVYKPLDIIYKPKSVSHNTSAISSYTGTTGSGLNCSRIRTSSSSSEEKIQTIKISAPISVESNDSIDCEVNLPANELSNARSKTSKMATVNRFYSGQSSVSDGEIAETIRKNIPEQNSTDEFFTCDPLIDEEFTKLDEKVKNVANVSPSYSPQYVAETEQYLSADFQGSDDRNSVTKVSHMNHLVELENYNSSGKENVPKQQKRSSSKENIVCQVDQERILVEAQNLVNRVALNTENSEEEFEDFKMSKSRAKKKLFQSSQESIGDLLSQTSIVELFRGNPEEKVVENCSQNCDRKLQVEPRNVQTEPESELARKEHDFLDKQSTASDDLPLIVIRNKLLNEAEQKLKTQPVVIINSLPLKSVENTMLQANKRKKNKLKKKHSISSKEIKIVENIPSTQSSRASLKNNLNTILPAANINEVNAFSQETVKLVANEDDDQIGNSQTSLNNKQISQSAVFNNNYSQEKLLNIQKEVEDKIVQENESLDSIQADAILESDNDINKLASNNSSVVGNKEPQHHEDHLSFLEEVINLNEEKVIENGNVSNSSKIVGSNNYEAQQHEDNLSVVEEVNNLNEKNTIENDDVSVMTTNTIRRLRKLYNPGDLSYLDDVNFKTNQSVPDLENKINNSIFKNQLNEVILEENEEQNKNAEEVFESQFSNASNEIILSGNVSGVKKKSKTKNNSVLEATSKKEKQKRSKRGKKTNIAKKEKPQRKERKVKKKSKKESKSFTEIILKSSNVFNNAESKFGFTFDNVLQNFEKKALKFERAPKNRVRIRSSKKSKQPRKKIDYVVRKNSSSSSSISSETKLFVGKSKKPTPVKRDFSDETESDFDVTEKSLIVKKLKHRRPVKYGVTENEIDLDIIDNNPVEKFFEPKNDAIDLNMKPKKINLISDIIIRKRNSQNEIVSPIPQKKLRLEDEVALPQLDIESPNKGISKDLRMKNALLSATAKLFLDSKPNLKTFNTDIDQDFIAVCNLLEKYYEK